PSPRAKLFQQWINSLPVNPYKPPEEIELSPGVRFDFFKIVNNLLHWFKKREQYALINEQRPPFKKMNELEVIFLLLEEDELMYRKKGYIKKGYSKRGYFKKKLKMRKKIK
ncbi:MAG: hypothetical protein PF590_09845, partial [Candidatus Delongbacteria bacterium]|nr:hypothetical protein [Candidatus Delongbacteria bacterium]